MDAYTGHQAMVLPPDSESMLEYIQAMKETKELQWADMEEINIQPHRVRHLSRCHNAADIAQVVPPAPDTQTHAVDAMMFSSAIYDTLDSGMANDVEMISNQDQSDIHKDCSEVGLNDKEQDPTNKRAQDAPIWVKAADKALYCEPQSASECALHALNALTGKQLLTAAEVVHHLQMKDVPPRKTPEDPARYAPYGHFSTAHDDCYKSCPL